MADDKTYLLKKDFENDKVTKKVSFDKVDHLFCLTLYNEESDFLSSTLLSILKNSNELRENDSFEKVMVCIICDGYEKISNSSFEYLKKINVLNGDKAYVYRDEELKDDDFASIYRQKSGPFTLYEDGRGSTISSSMDIMLCIKNKNAGKLDSHWWFFNKICPLILPEYCYQIDAGTVLAKGTLQNMSSAFMHYPQTVAFSNNVLIESENPFDFLESFQVFDFILQKAILWPSESFFGYLSVIPGQFCAIRYDGFDKSKIEGESTPKERYLRGLECSSPFEKTMYMAEDRMMGFELLVQNQSDNRLEYNPQSTCYTDKCDSIDEFLSQRRRWCNSAFMCRIWMMFNMLRYWENSTSSIFKKAHTMSSLISMVLNTLFDFFQPFIVFLVLSVVFDSIDGVVDKNIISSSFSKVLLCFIVFSWMLPLIFSFSSYKSNRYFFRFVLIMASAATSLSILFIVSGVFLSDRLFEIQNVIIFYPIIFVVIVLLSSLLISYENYRLALRSFIPHFLIAIPFNLMTFGYSFINMNDSSWGTKGLSNNVENKINAKKFLYFRNKFVFIWLFLNLSLILFSVFSDGYIGLISFVGYLSLIIMFTGFLGNLRIYCLNSFKMKSKGKIKKLNY
ncbi:Chitin synthase [Marinomonas spartinae]|uniref:hypothetical protein n=1 Tax=Marinomonas spartinae TaxID=1792290 RepID=UPI000808DB08|nr:hypothetical protein [Marinomonas spartinae]SBS39239.1 Chitin synthase [Marinomonas spartinae]